MKYFLRSVKYFVSLVVIMSLIIGVMMAAKFIPQDINEIFKNGYDSIWQILLIFVAVSAVYPKFGYIKKDVSFTGAWDENKGTIISYMQEHNFVVESDTEEGLTFRQRSKALRIIRMGEDKIIICPMLGGATIEGARKDAFRLGAGIEYVTRSGDEQ